MYIYMTMTKTTPSVKRALDYAQSAQPSEERGAEQSSALALKRPRPQYWAPQTPKIMFWLPHTMFHAISTPPSSQRRISSPLHIPKNARSVLPPTFYGVVLVADLLLVQAFNRVIKSTIWNLLCVPRAPPSDTCAGAAQLSSLPAVASPCSLQSHV